MKNTDKNNDSAMFMSNSLASEEGAVWLSKVEQVLMARIDKLVKEDQFCQGIVDTLSLVNCSLGLSKKKTEQLMGAVGKNRRG